MSNEAEERAPVAAPKDATPAPAEPAPPSDPAAKSLKKLNVIVKQSGRMLDHFDTFSKALNTLADTVVQLDQAYKISAQSAARSQDKMEQGLIESRAAVTQEIRGVVDQLAGPVRDSAYATVFKTALPALDDMDIVLARSSGELDVAVLTEAVRNLREKLLTGFAAGGLSEIPVEVGKDSLDGRIHNAVAAVTAADDPALGDVPKNTVVGVRRSGYRIGEQVVRAADVVVKGGAE